MAVGGTKVVQVTNIAPQATKDQMQTLFGFLGKIEDIRLYPTIRDVSCPVQSRICYIKFMESSTVGIAQHMTNTVFIDRALIVIPVQSGDIPDEYYALEMTKNGTIVPGLCPTEPKLPPNVVNSISGNGIEQVIVTTDPQLEVNGLASYPPLPANYDSCKIEEIRRTVLVGIGETLLPSNIHELIEFFSPAGEIKYMRSCNRTADGSPHYLIEFSEQPSVLEALKMDGKIFRGKTVTVGHATQAIVKPQAKSNEAAQREIEEAMSRVKEAQSLISAAIDPVIGLLSKDKRGSRRSRSRSRGRRRRSRSRSRSRRSRSRDRRRRSRSRSRDRDRERRRRTRSRSRDRRSRSRRSRSRRSRSKSHTSKSSRKERRRSREKSRERRSRERDRSRERSSRRTVEKERRSRDKEREKDRDSKCKDRGSKEKRSDRESSVEKEDKVLEKKRSRSVSRGKYRSRSRERDRKSGREKRRSRSRERRRRSPSRERRRKSRSRSRERSKREKRDRKDKERSSSRSKVLTRIYEDDEKDFDSEKEKNTDRKSVV